MPDFDFEIADAKASLIDSSTNDKGPADRKFHIPGVETNRARGVREPPIAAAVFLDHLPNQGHRQGPKREITKS